MPRDRYDEDRERSLVGRILVWTVRAAVLFYLIPPK